MGADAKRGFNQDPDFEAAVDLLIEKYGLEDAENRLLAALSAVRRRKAEASRRGG